jgi:exodeoxyribonuclease V gamma subunit
MQTGDVDDPCLARMFPDFETLTEDGRFEALARQVYEPLRNWAAAHVSARWHTVEQAPGESAA